MPGQWTSTDAWVFAAIAGGVDSPVRDSTLTEVIHTSDVINHAVPTESEFVRAVARLTAVGVIGVSEDGSRYWPTVAGQELRRRWRRGYGMFRWGEALLPGLRKLGPPPDYRWSLPKGAFAQVVEEFNEEARGILQRLARGRRRPLRKTVPSSDS